MRIHLYGRTDLQIGHETIQQKKNAQTNRIKNNTHKILFMKQIRLTVTLHQ